MVAVADCDLRRNRENADTDRVGPTGEEKSRGVGACPDTYASRLFDPIMKNPAIVIVAVLGSMTSNPLLAQRSADASAAHGLTMLEEPKEHGGVQAYSIATDGRWLAGGTGVVTASVDGVAIKRGGGDVLIWDARSGKI